jgi:hypothetical protein
MIKQIKKKKLYYNIHALKLRELKGYQNKQILLKNSETDLLKNQKDWENVRIDFGPLTLMEGWINLNAETIHNDIIDLSEKFLKISPIIDETLKYFNLCRAYLK